MARVSVGPTTVGGAGVTVAAFVAAIVAFASGARDEATVGALVAGVAALVTTLIGRYAQAIAQVKAAAPTIPPAFTDPSLVADPMDSAGCDDHPVGA